MKTTRRPIRRKGTVATIPPGGVRSAGADIPKLFRRLTAAGFGPAGAGNLSGVMVGLRPVTSAWTLREIHALVFLRELVRQERIVH